MQCIHSQGVHQSAYLLQQGQQEDLKGGFAKISQRHQFEFSARIAVVAFLAVLNFAGYRVTFQILSYFSLEDYALQCRCFNCALPGVIFGYLISVIICDNL